MDNTIVFANQPLGGSFEIVLNSLSQLFFWPIVTCVLLMFVFSLLSLGGMLVESVQRWFHPGTIHLLEIKSDSTIESLELEILRQLEALRLCSRVAPMLGLVATMIPLGPALVSLSSANPSTQTQTLGHSFAVVIIALLSASVTFSIYTVRRRWLLTELNQWLKTTDSPEVSSS